ncbi:MAG: bifunctional riboflavin kinase/FAD synthetase [Syntrophaceae bacterium]
MEIFWGNDCIDSMRLTNSVVTIGNFDGCHAGHREIFRRTREHARAVGGVSVVYTFNPHPGSVIQGGTPQLIFSQEEKIAEVEACGMDYMVIVPFTREFANMQPEQFIDEVILGRIMAKGVVVGHDFCFGRQAKGDIAFLQKIGGQRGFFVETVAPVVHQGMVVSSTCLRGMIRSGDVAGAALLLPHPFRLHGPVVHGMSRGRTLGYPTANIRPDKSLLPAYGVYAVQVYMGTGIYPGVANMGDNPTFGDEGTSLEVFIFDFQGDIYGNELTVEFIERLRDEIRFENKDQLIAQIEKDCRDARTILSRRTGP